MVSYSHDDIHQDASVTITFHETSDKEPYRFPKATWAGSILDGERICGWCGEDSPDELESVQGDLVCTPCARTLHEEATTTVRASR